MENRIVGAGVIIVAVGADIHGTTSCLWIARVVRAQVTVPNPWVS